MLSNLFYKYKNMSDGLKASAWFMICNLMQKAISFITIPIFTRLLSSEEYGFFSIFTSWEGILSIFVTLNLSYQVFNNGMVKFKSDKDGYASSMVGLTLVSSVFFLLIFFIFRNSWSRITGINLLYTLMMFTDMIFVGIIGIWTVRQRYDFKYKLLVAITIFTMIANPLLGIIFVIKFEDKIFGRILSMIIVNVLVGFISLLLLIKKGNKFISLKYWKYALKLNIPLIPHYLAMVVLNSSDRIMIGEICGNEFVAYYSVAYNVAMIMQMFISSINSSFNPWIYQKLENKEYSDIKKVSSYLVVFMGVLSILPMFFGPEIISILGSKEYMMASYVMPIISSSVFMIYLYSLFISVELFYEKSKFVMYGSVCATVINIILNLIFIKKFGFIAAGYTTLLSYIALTLFHYLFTKKITVKIKINNIFNIKLLILLSGMIISLSIVIQLLYSYIIIRYLILIIVIFIILFYKNKIMLVYKQIKNKSEI